MKKWVVAGIAILGLLAINGQTALVGWGTLVIAAMGSIRLWWKDHQATVNDFLTKATSHFGRPADADWYTRKDGRTWRLMIWIAERQFYFASARKAFDPVHLYTAADVREWAIERTREVSSSKYWDEYAVNISVKSTSTPLLKVHCGRDQALAYKVSEMFHQMCGEQATESVDYAISSSGLSALGAKGQ